MKRRSVLTPCLLVLLALAALIGAAVAVLPALAAAPSEAKLEVNENCVEANWPCWATPGSGSSLQAGSVSFSVPLNTNGKAALRRHRRLALTVKVTLTPQPGAAVTVTRSVVVHT
jgi:hypothetical protein